MTRVGARVRALWHALTRRGRFDSDMHDEIRFHLDMEADRLVREQGLDAVEARRRAFVAFGGVEKYKEEGRDTRGLLWLDALSLDFRLGLRMLVKHRALTVIGGFALAVAIAIGATTFEVVTEAMYAPLPMDEGDRVVSIVYETDNPGNPERRILNEFQQWRSELQSIQQVSAFRTAERNLAAAAEHPEPTYITEISPAAFALARTPPHLGRYLLPDDERVAAPRVIVIGYEAWQSRFGGDAAIVGRSITLDGEPHEVVGVMPDGFRFPINHQYWIALRPGTGEFGPLQGPQIHVMGRLAPRTSLDEAQAELTTVGQQNAAANPRVYERMQPVVLPYTREHSEVRDPVVAWLVWIGQVLISALVIVVGINVAVLMYAHIMGRRAEMAVRTALGASRRRILGQLFLEAFALSLLGAVIGLLLSQITLQEFRHIVVASGGAFIPYWIRLSVSPTTVLYSIGLAAVAAVIVGVLPGLRVTGAGVQSSLRELGAGGGSVRLGRTWSFLIVAQVTVAVAVLPLALLMVWKVAQIETGHAGFPVEQYLVGEVWVADESRLRTRHEQLMARLTSDRSVAAVTFSSAVPGTASALRRIEFDLSTREDASGQLARDAALRPTGILQVDPKLFETYRARFLAGRPFDAADRSRASNAVIVDRTFVQLFMGTRPPLGQRFRYTQSVVGAADAASFDVWYEIVGVADDIPASPLEPASEKQPTVYHAAAHWEVNPLVLSVRLTGVTPSEFAGRFRAIGADIDPAMRLRSVEPLTDVYDRTRSLGRFLAWGMSLVTASVLLLSAAGMYALMSFTLAQRTREIGIRTALGAPPRRVVASIFGRVTRQVAIGIVIGSGLSCALVAGMPMTRLESVMLLLIVPGIITIVGLVAVLGPTRRSLRVPTMEALRV